jgi:hypothetical protein
MDIWKLIGIAPFTRECLSDSQVRHEIVVDQEGTIDVDADPLTTKLLQIETLNKAACQVLKDHGCNTEPFRKDAPRAKIAAVAVTVPHTKERQDLLMAAATAGRRFHATGGEQLNSDDWFIGQERKNRILESNKLEVCKQEWEAYRAREQKATDMIEHLHANGIDVYDNQAVCRVLLPQLKVLWQWKYGKSLPTGKNKAHLVAEWNDAKHEPSQNKPAEWTADDEQKLVLLAAADIHLHETEVGKQAGKMVDDVKAIVQHMSLEQIRDLRAALPTTPTTEQPTATADAVVDA